MEVMYAIAGIFIVCAVAYLIWIKTVWRSKMRKQEDEIRKIYQEKQCRELREMLGTSKRKENSKEFF